MTSKWSFCLCVCLLLGACSSQTEPVVEPMPLESNESFDSLSAEAQDPLKLTESTFPAGKRFDYGPAKNTVMHVVGVRFDDVLNLRKAPGANAELVTSKAPGPLPFPQLLSLGSGWLLDNGAAWWHAEINDPGNARHGLHVWAHTNYLKPLAAASNKTNAIVQIIGSDYSGVENLKQKLLQLRSGDSSSIKIVVSQDEMGLDASGGSVQIELLGYKDDSVYGEIFYFTFTNQWDNSKANDRKITGQQIGQILVTPVCQRGVSDGLCL